MLGTRSDDRTPRGTFLRGPTTLVGKLSGEPTKSEYTLRLRPDQETLKLSNSIEMKCIEIDFNARKAKRLMGLDVHQDHLVQ